jgi:hypothetical protein
VHLVKEIAKKYPSLTFSLLYLDECGCYAGYIVPMPGDRIWSAQTSDVCRFKKPEGHECDDDSVVDPRFYKEWEFGERLQDALNCVSADDAAGAGDKYLRQLADLRQKWKEWTQSLNSETSLGDIECWVEEFCWNITLFELDVRRECSVKAAIDMLSAASGTSE